MLRWLPRYLLQSNGRTDARTRNHQHLFRRPSVRLINILKAFVAAARLPSAAKNHGVGDATTSPHVQLFTVASTMTDGRSGLKGVIPNATIRIHATWPCRPGQLATTTSLEVSDRPSPFLIFCSFSITPLHVSCLLRTTILLTWILGFRNWNYFYSVAVK